MNSCRSTRRTEGLPQVADLGDDYTLAIHDNFSLAVDKCNDYAMKRYHVSSGVHLCYGEGTFMRNRERRAAYHRTHDN